MSLTDVLRALAHPVTGEAMGDKIRIDNFVSAAERAADEIERLRAALTEIAAIEDEQYGGDWDEIERAREIASKALLQ